MLLPAALLWAGLDAALDFKEERRIEAVYQALEGHLKSLKDEIVLETDRLAIARSALDRLIALPELDGPGVAELRADLERANPGLLAWAVFEAGATGPVRLVQADRGLSRTIVEAVARRFLSPPPPGASPGADGVLALASQLFGRTYTLDYLAGRPGELHGILRGRRSQSFYWNLVGRGAGRPRGAVFLFIDDEVFRAGHSPARLAARRDEAARREGIRIDLASGDRTAEAALARIDPTIDPALAIGADAPRRRLGERSLIAAFRIRDTDRLAAIAWTARGGVFPAGGLLRAGGRSLVAAAALAATLALLLAAAGRYRPFVPVRVRLVGLFLYAALPPLSVILIFGFRYLKEREATLARETYDAIRERIRTADEEVGRERTTLREFCLAVAGRPELAGRRSTREIDLHGFHEHLLGLYAKREVEDYVIVDTTGVIVNDLIQHTGHPLIQTIVPQLSVAMIQYANGNSYDVESIKAGGGDSIQKLFFANRYDFADQMIRNMGQLHVFRFLHWNYTLFFQPLTDPDGRAFGMLCLIVDVAMFHRNALIRIVDGENARPDAKLRLAMASVLNRERRHPVDDFEREDLRRLFERVASEKIPIDATLRHAAGPTGEVLASAVPLKEAENYILIGSVPAARIRAELAWNLQAFALILLVVIGVATGVGAGLARNLIRPVRALESGVRAVAGGDLTHRVSVESRDEFGALAETFNGMVTGLQEKARMSRYVSEFVLEEVKRESDGSGPLGVLKKGTILFSDLRDFTTLTEAHPPEAIVRMLNAYLEAMTIEIARFGGIVDKFIGDAVMAVFYPEPGETEGDERRAVLASLAMRRALRRFNRDRLGRGEFQVENGIGLNTGTVIQGSIGSRAHRVDLTVVGDAVNTAARLESLSKGCLHEKIVLSKATFEAARDLVDVRDMGEVTVKGKTASVKIFEVVGPKPAAAAALGADAD